jgi:hypothetical protein
MCDSAPSTSLVLARIGGGAPSSLPCRHLVPTGAGVRRVSSLLDCPRPLGRGLFSGAGVKDSLTVGIRPLRAFDVVGGVSGACSATQCGENRAWNGGACCLRFGCGRNEHLEVSATTALFANPAHRSGWKPRTLPLSAGPSFWPAFDPLLALACAIFSAGLGLTLAAILWGLA